MPLVHIVQVVGALTGQQQVGSQKGVVCNAVQVEPTAAQHVPGGLRPVEELRLIACKPLSQGALIVFRHVGCTNNDAAIIRIHDR